MISPTTISRTTGQLLKSCLCCFAITALCSASMSMAGTLNVPADYDTIQSAVDAAKDGDIIEVEAGTYHEAVVIKDISDLTLVAPDRATIDAEGEQTSAVEISHAGSTEMPVALIGFDIINGTGQRVDDEGFDDDRPLTDLSGDETYGGGLLNRRSVVQIDRCSFHDNVVTGAGGAVANLVSTVAVTDSTFYLNEAGPWGGGMFNYRSDVAVQGHEPESSGWSTTVFRQNSADTNSGAIDNYDSNLILNRVKLEDNRSGHGGAMLSKDDEETGYGQNLEVTNCLFKGNVGSGNGGAIFLIEHTKVTLKNTIFDGNGARLNGGGLHVFSTSVKVTVEDSVFIDNNATEMNGGGLSAAHMQEGLVVKATRFEGNEAYEEGGGLRIKESAATITGSEFKSNLAGTEGGGIGQDNKGEKPSVGDSFFCGNEPEHIEKPWNDLGGNEFQDACDTGENPPSVESLSLSEVETNDEDAEFDISWGVSDPDGNLDSVKLVLTDESDNGEQEDAATVSISGDTANGTDRLIAVADDGSGHTYKVTATVSDSDGNSDSASETATESEGANAPTIDKHEISETGSPNPHLQISVDWAVSDNDGDLSLVKITAEDADGNEFGDANEYVVSGSSASGTDTFEFSHADDEAADVTIYVEDSSGESESHTEQVTE